MSKRKNNKTKVMILVLVTICIFLSYKGYILNEYNTNKLNTETYDNFLQGYKIQKTITVERTDLNENEYLSFENVKVKNILGTYTEKEQISKYIKHAIYKKKSKNGETADYIQISIADPYIEWFKSTEKNFYVSIDKEGESISLEADIEDYLEENNITTDLELFKFLSDTRSYKPNIFTNTEKIKDHYGTQLVASIAMPKIDSFTIIEGVYNGYILNINNIKEINVIHNNERYTFMLYNKTEEETLDFLNTLVID